VNRAHLARRRRNGYDHEAHEEHEVYNQKYTNPSWPSGSPLKIRGAGASISLKQNPSIASFQHGVLESIYESFVKSGYSRIFIPSNLFGQISPCRP
jgi:hypothetical protein